MYSYIKGKLVDREEDYIVVDNNDIGYQILCPIGISSSLGHLGEVVTVYLYQSVREDDISLYGFSSKEQKDIFLLLITVSGVGPKVAQSICSQIAPDVLACAVINKDTTLLTGVKGLGKKTSERIILEISDKLKKSSIAKNTSSKVVSLTNTSGIISSVVDDCANALIVLGYRDADAIEVAKSCYEENMSLQELIRKSLKSMARK